MSSPKVKTGPCKGHFATLGAAGITLLALVPTSAQADVRYTTSMDMSAMMGNNQHSQSHAAPPAEQTTTYVKGTSERVETSFQFGSIKSTSITIQQCGTHEEIKLDPADKLYTENTIGALNFAPQRQPGMQRGAQSSPVSGGDGTGQVITTINAQDLGYEVISNLKTHHTMMTMRIQTSGCSGNNDSTMKMELWTAPIQTYSCPEQFAASREVGSSPGGGGGGCKVTYVMHGDILAMRNAYSGMMVQMKMYTGDKVTVQQNLVDYSQATLDPGLFQVPSDYTKVSDEEFSKAQSKAMMRGLMGGGQGNQPPDNDQGTPNTGDNSSTDNGDNPPPKPKGHSFGGIHLPF